MGVREKSGFPGKELIYLEKEIPDVALRIEAAREIFESATLAGTVIGSGKTNPEGES